MARNLATEILRGAVAVLSLPFTLFRRSASSIGERSQSVRRAKFDTSKWNLDLLRHLEWRRFEELCAAYLEGAARPTVLARCKAWSPYPTGIRVVQELQAAMATAGVGEAVLLSSGRFTQEAAQFAAKNGIQLLDGAQLLEQFALLAPEKSLALLKLATKGDFLTPTCPCCSIKMTSRKSTGEGRAFWGCQNYPRCKQTVSAAALAP